MSDIASPGPIDPNSGQPDHHAEVSALKAWLRQNLVSMVITAVVVALVCVYLDPVDTVKVVLGLGFIIFIHELGHFLAAKSCDVHVKTFSIGFGPAVPFCSYKWGETTYMLGVIPLGGYVSMVGEGTGESTPDGDPDDDDRDPRSFKNKSVGQRMLIISAGVIMNVIFGMACFVGAYLHGVQEKPATVGTVESGSAAWRAGLRTGDDIKLIGRRHNPFFNDIRSVVMSSSKGEAVPVEIERVGPDGKPIPVTTAVEPIRAEGVPFPQLGVAAPARLTLVESKKRSIRPVVPGSPAAAADPRFEQGDRIVAMTDPANPAEVTPLAPDRHDKGKPDFNDYYRRMVDLAERPVTFHVLRKGQPDGAGPTAITVPPVFRADLGLRMRMGKVAAVRADHPDAVVVQAVPVGAEPTAQGDRIVEVRVTDAAGKRRWFVADGKRPPDAKPDDAVRPLDPVLLPFELRRWAGEFPPEKRAGLEVHLVVLRVVEAEHTDKPVPLTLKYDSSVQYNRTALQHPNSPVPVDGLGLAYWVEAVVSSAPAAGTPAAEAGLQPEDLITAVRLKALDPDGNTKPGEWKEIKPHQWGAVEAAFQGVPPYEIDLRVKHGEEVREVTLRGRPDPTWGLPDRGLVFAEDFLEQKADGIADAIGLGAYRTVRFVKDIYMNLYAMVRGRVSTRTMSGPLTIATVSYKIAGEDFWQFLLFLGLISVNLAVVNFLPIPVLDGGHMVFLIIEKVLGRPVPERLFAAAMWVGLALILLLFLYVITLDIQRLFFGVF
ncbi:MAG: putative zinc metalloprotease [Gemmataceae bacterium]|nr:putative zinc metalloprotease [Gemmataceae bacterium]